MKQDEVAEQMRAAGHPTWSRNTISQVEKGGRSVTVDELMSLAAIFDVGYDDLLTRWAD